MRPIPAEEFSIIVGAIYDCALEPSKWPAALAMLRDRMNFANASLDTFDIAAGRVALSEMDGMNQTRLGELKAHGLQMVEQWGGADRVRGLPLGEPLLLSQIRPAGLTRESPFYEQFDEPEDIIDVMTLRLCRTPDTIWSIAFGRRRDQGAVVGAELSFARLVYPHIRRAITVSRLLEARAVERDTFAAILDGLALAVILVGRDLRLIHANRAGETLLRTGDPVGLRHGRLVAPNGVAAALKAALAAPFHGIGQSGLGIPARRADGEEFVLHLLPLADANPMHGAAAAIFIAPGATLRPAPLAAVAALFDLTAAEARILELIGACRTNAEIALALGIAVSTVRTHLLRLFEKTGTHRQADLVALLASFTLPLA